MGDAFKTVRDVACVRNRSGGSDIASVPFESLEDSDSDEESQRKP